MKFSKMLFMLLACIVSFAMLGSTTSHMEQKQKSVFTKELQVSIDSVIVVQNDLILVAEDFKSQFTTNEFKVSLAGLENVFKPNHLAVVMDVGWQFYKPICYLKTPYKENLRSQFNYPDLPDKTSRSNC